MRFRQILCSAGLVCMVCVPCSLAPLRRACGDIVVSTFDEFENSGKLDITNTCRGESGPADAQGNRTGVSSSFRSGNVTFQNDGLNSAGGFNFWSGIGLSKRTTQVGQLFENGNDLISRPATGAGGSPVWAVVANAGSMTADNGYQFASVDLTNTLYTWTSMNNGDAFAGPPFRNGGGTGRNLGQDDFFTVRFQNTLAPNSFLDFNLADFRGATDFILGTCTPVSFDLSPLGARQLSISFLGSRETNVSPPNDPPLYFLDTPLYLAMDNIRVASIASVPEPGSLALVLLVGLAWGGYRAQVHRRVGRSG